MIAFAVERRHAVENECPRCASPVPDQSLCDGEQVTMRCDCGELLDVAETCGAQHVKSKAETWFDALSRYGAERRKRGMTPHQCGESYVTVDVDDDAAYPDGIG